MDDRDYKILQLRIDGKTPQEIQEIDGRSLSRIKAILYDPRFKNMVRDGQEERNTRSEKPAGERMGDILNTALSALEKRLDAAAGDPDKVLSLVPRMVELGKIVPPARSSMVELGVAILPEMDTEEDFNTPTLGRETPNGNPESPTGDGITPGGSKTPAPTRKLELDLPENTEVDDWEVIEGELEKAAEGW